MRRFLAPLLACLAIGIAAPSAARAGEVTDAQRAEVKIGLTAYEGADFEEALRHWLPVFGELDRTQRYRLAFNIARASDNLGREESAALFYEEYLEGLKAAPADIPDRSRLDEQGSRANSRLLALRARLTRVAFADGAYTVELDGRLFHPRDVAYLRPGSYRFVFSRDGKAIDDRLVSLRAGEARVLGPELDARPPAITPIVPVLPTPIRSPQKTAPPFPLEVLYVGAGLTLLSTSLPIATYLSGADYSDTHRLSSNIADEPRNASIRAEYASLETRHYLALSVPITLGLATGALALWYALSPRRGARIEGALLRF